MKMCSHGSVGKRYEDEHIRKATECKDHLCSSKEPTLSPAWHSSLWEGSKTLLSGKVMLGSWLYKMVLTSLESRLYSRKYMIRTWICFLLRCIYWLTSPFVDLQNAWVFTTQYCCWLNDIFSMKEIRLWVDTQSVQLSYQVPFYFKAYSSIEWWDRLVEAQLQSMLEEKV